MTKLKTDIHKNITELVIVAIPFLPYIVPLFQTWVCKLMLLTDSLNEQEYGFFVSAIKLTPPGKKFIRHSK